MSRLAQLFGVVIARGMDKVVIVKLVRSVAPDPRIYQEKDEGKRTVPATTRTVWLLTSTARDLTLPYHVSSCSFLQDDKDKVSLVWCVIYVSHAAP